MRKVIKSGKDIQKEIDSLFENYKTDADLLERMSTYLENLTGKELYSKTLISNMVHSALCDQLRNGKITLDVNSPIIGMYPHLKDWDNDRHKENMKYVYNSHRYFRKHSHAIILLSQIYNILDGGVEAMYEYWDQSEWFPDMKKENPVFAKLHTFLIKNSDAAEMLHSHVNRMNQELIVELIIDDIIPLKSILLYFDVEKDIKENTIELYKILRNKIPRVNIQSVITDNLEMIKSGKFQRAYF